MEKLPIGIYDHILDQELEDLIGSIDQGRNIAQVTHIDEALLPDYLTRTLAEHIQKSLKIVPKEKRYKLANKLIRTLSEFDAELDFISNNQLIPKDNNLLKEIHAIGELAKQIPSTSLSFPSLFTGAAGCPQLGRELGLELESADRMDMLVSFIKSAGINLLFPALKEFTDRGGELRIITTTYLGASDPTAIHKLKSLKNTEIKVSYDTKHSRLHAKAYFIHRNSGLSCAYIGSANLSHAAMTSGLEWTVKLPLKKLPDLFRRCQAEFETYWESPSFKDYYESDFDYLMEATRREKYPSTNPSTKLTLFELSPYEHQLIVLDELKEARTERNQCRNLVVAATGTGKTMIAAFDYKQLCESKKERPKLLFLAHRKEILEQAKDSFRQVLIDGDFGESLFDGKQPSNHDYLFSSVPSFNSRNLIDQFGAKYWDVVILDEAHHGKADSYRDILQRLKPQILLGLTATPERTDGTSIAEDFDTPLAAEIRLPDALEKKLLCPFHYYAVSDTVDFSSVSWTRGKYDQSELSNLLTGNDVRVSLIIKKIIEYLPSPLDPNGFDSAGVKGLGFCVSREHAHFMAKSFNNAGISAIALDSKSPADDRHAARSHLNTGKINFIFTVDLFNEGIDIPSVNCLLFLRPTESHVVYLQQFGRGLRHSTGKDQVIVLDFIGKERKEFRYDLRLKALLPGKRNDLTKEIEVGFPHLPAGCSIQFEKTAKEQIIKNIRRTYNNPDIRIDEAFSEWKGKAAPSFREFINRTAEIPTELLTRKSWSDWKDASHFQTSPQLNQRAPELNSLARTCMITSPAYLKFIRDLLLSPDNELQEIIRHPYAASAYYLLWNKPGKKFGFTSYFDAFKQLKANKRYKDDLLEITEYAQSMQVTRAAVELPFSSPLELHGQYTMREISSAFGKANLETSGPTGTGVIPVKHPKLYIHFVTFEKTQKLFSESTMYRDFLSSRTRLHWESQSNTSQATPTGQNYILHQERGYTILFFARFRKAEGKLTSPFTYLGPAQFVNATGNRPIEMVWELKHPVTHQFFHEAKLAAGIS
jgi:superfamily II DNA or RNA helicase/HKD family nuclease